MQPDYDIDELSCPHCEHYGTHSRRCSNILCEDGAIDLSDEDYMLPGSKTTFCEVCSGTGIERWCPNCGKDLSAHVFDDDENYE